MIQTENWFVIKCVLGRNEGFFKKWNNPFKTLGQEKEDSSVL